MKKWLKMIMLSLMMIVILAVYDIFNLYIVYYLDQYWNVGAFILFMVNFAMIFMILLGFGHSIRMIRIYREYRNVLLLAAACVGLFIFMVHPLRQIGVDFDFRLYKADREKVVDMIRDFRIKYEDTGLYSAKLPDEFKNTSKSVGAVIVRKNDGNLAVCFTSASGLWRVYTGMIHIDRDSDEEAAAAVRGMPVTNLRKVEPHWYYADMRD